MANSIAFYFMNKVVYIDLKTGDICTEKGEKKSGYILTEKVLETIRKKTSFLNVSGEYLVLSLIHI